MGDQFAIAKSCASFLHLGHESHENNVMRSPFPSRLFSWASHLSAHLQRASQINMVTAMDFALEHKGQLGIITALVVYSAAKNKLTPAGIAAAIVTAGIHMLHPWGVFFNLLVGFFIAGTVGTKVRLLRLFPCILGLGIQPVFFTTR
jgi:hypothetical protein